MTVPPTAKPKPQPQPWQSVTEPDSLFLALFPHRFDYLWAEHPDPGERPNWQTESRHPLSDRLLQQGAYLYGVRFGKLTRYCVLDVDRQSTYHPTRDPLAIKRMVAALESIGLVAYVVVTSSYSGGLHVYLPFAEEQPSWAIALVVSTLLENAGFKLKPGQLEVFPNPRPYTNGTPSLYTGHRVPMQAGSYLLNDHWEPVYSDQAAFVRQWQWAEGRNDLNHKTLQLVLKQAQRRRYKNVTVSAQQFLNDLDTEVEQGWTGTGQTNRLLGRIAMREYVFGHVLRSGTPLTGQALVDAIVEVAVALPGYEEWCRHQHEIHKLARNWARDIEADPNYYPYDPHKRRKTATQPANNIVCFDCNQQRALDAEQRIKVAIAALQASHNFPSGTTARADAIIASAQCSKRTLHKHKALWHPDYTEGLVRDLPEAVTAPSDSHAVVPLETLEALPDNTVPTVLTNKFMPYPAALLEQADRFQAFGGSGGISSGQVDSPVQEPERSTTAAETLATDQADLAPPADSTPKDLPQPQSRSAGATVLWVTEKRQRQAAAKAAQMQAWLASGDHILVKEAEAWFGAQVERRRGTLPTERGDPRGGSDHECGESDSQGWL